MAKRPTTRSKNTLAMAMPEESVSAGRTVDGESADGDTTIIIDAKTGHVKKINADGSVEIKPLGKPKPERGAANFDENFAEFLDETVLQRIATRLLEGIDNDIRSRADWEETAERGAELLGVKLEEATGEIGDHGGISNIKNTAMLEACLSMWANSRAELLPVNGPVKVRDDKTQENKPAPAAAAEVGIGHNGGPPMDVPPAAPGPNLPTPGGIAAGAGQASPNTPPPPTTMESRNQLAKDFQDDFNHYLTVVDKEYYPDYSRMLMSRGLLGCQFRKVYRDPLLRRPVSRWVKGVDLIVSNEATHLTGAARVTERIMMRQTTVKRMQVAKHWREVQLVIPTGQHSNMDKAIANLEGIDKTPLLPADFMHAIYECYTELGEQDDEELAKDHLGKTIPYPLPYRITIDRDSRKVLEIRRNWKRTDPEYQPRRRYVKYGLVPGLGFYDWGFVHLIGNPQRGATMIEQVLMDTGMLNSFPGGVMGKSPGTRQRTTEIRPSPGEFVVMDTGGLPIQDFVMPWPYKEPSNTLKELGGDLQSQMKRIAGVVELPVGEGMTNVPVGTIMSYIESVTKVPSAVHKDDHIAQQDEFELLRELFAEDPESLSKFARKPKRKWSVAQEILDQDLVPAADPNVPSQTHRLMQVSMLNDIGGRTQYQGIANQRTIFETTVRTLGFSNSGEYTLPPPPPGPPPVDPKVQAAQIKADSEKLSDQAKLAEVDKKHQAKTEELATTSADKAAEQDTKVKVALINAHVAAAGQKVDLVKHGAGLASDHLQHADNLAHDHAQTGLDHIKHIDTMAAADADRAQAAAAPDAGIASPETPSQ